MIRPQLFHKKKFTFTVNWGYLLAIFSFWVYGFHGAINIGSLPFQLFFLLFLTCSFGMLITGSLYLKEKFSTVQTVFLKDVIIVLSIVSIFFIVAVKKFTQPLVGDQLFYTYWSKIHEILFLLKLNEFSNLSFDDFKAVTVIHLFSLTICAFVGIFFFVITRYTFSKPLIILTLCFWFVFFRLLVITMGGGGNPHPPGQLLPIWITTSLFGLNNFTYQLLLLLLKIQVQTKSLSRLFFLKQAPLHPF